MTVSRYEQCKSDKITGGNWPQGYTVQTWRGWGSSCHRWCVPWFRVGNWKAWGWIGSWFTWI